MSAAAETYFEWAWRDDAACKGTPIDWWFPNVNEKIMKVTVPPHVAERCAVCPVRQECLDHAVRNERLGIWAGMTGRSLTRLRRAAGVRLDAGDLQETTVEAVRLHQEGTPPRRSLTCSA